MSTIAEISLGQTIRRIRVSKKLKLKDLATETNLTQSLLSQIERNKTTPSISTLRRIGLALGCPLSLFFSNEMPKEGLVVRKGTNKTYYIAESKMKFELLSPDLRDRKMETAIVTMGKGGDTGEEMTWHHGEEMTLVIKGKILFQMNNEEYILNEGDSIYYNATTPHRVVNIGEEDAVMYYAASPPNF